jgi:hypothetical protein
MIAVVPTLMLSVLIVVAILALRLNTALAS